jgi:type VI secretion system secreted protein VgrG
VALLVVAWSPAAYAALPPVGLGTAAPFAVLAGTTVTNTGPTVINGDLGVSPGSAVTGFPPGLVNGSQHAADAVALQAQNDLTTAYNDAAGRTPATSVSTDLGGQTLAAGVYKAASSMGLTGTVTLDGENDPNAVFIFQAGSTLTAATGSTVALVRGAQACNVFWQVGSSADLFVNTTFVGTIMALTSINLQTNATLTGRALARNGAVTLDNNAITRPSCLAPTSSATPTTTPTSTAPTTTPTTTAPTTTPTTAPTTTPTNTTAPTTTPTSTAPTAPPGNGPHAPPGNGPHAPPGNGPHAPPAAGPPTPTIPQGHPHTGRAADLRAFDPFWFGAGGLALAGSALALLQAMRQPWRRRRTSR